MDSDKLEKTLLDINITARDIEAVLDGREPDYYDPGLYHGVMEESDTELDGITFIVKDMVGEIQDQTDELLDCIELEKGE